MLAGCIHFKEVSTNIAPTATTPQKYTAKMGVYFSQRLRNCLVTRKPDTMYGAAHEYNYVWGPSLVAALTRSVQSAYVEVTVVNTPPQGGECDRIIAFDLPWVDLIVEFVPGYLRQEARARAALKINLEVYDAKTMKLQRTMPVAGQGSSVKDASGFVAYAPGQFTAAMEQAIQQVSEIVSNLLIMGVAEPGKGT
uniref:ABC-type transport auxiliary lipoprotein component domain-containing protein n=1 Tax=Desulfobacca acetoxidans TaxID=60893 RepID=A0A7V6DPK7_9BACT